MLPGTDMPASGQKLPSREGPRVMREGSESVCGRLVSGKLA